MNHYQGIALLVIGAGIGGLLALTVVVVVRHKRQDASKLRQAVDASIARGARAREIDAARYPHGN